MANQFLPTDTPLAEVASKIPLPPIQASLWDWDHIPPFIAIAEQLTAKYGYNNKHWMKLIWKYAAKLGGSQPAIQQAYAIVEKEAQTEQNWVLYSRNYINHKQWKPEWKWSSVEQKLVLVQPPDPYIGYPAKQPGTNLP